MSVCGNVVPNDDEGAVAPLLGIVTHEPPAKPLTSSLRVWYTPSTSKFLDEPSLSVTVTVAVAVPSSVLPVNCIVKSEVGFSETGIGPADTAKLPTCALEVADTLTDVTVSVDDG